MTNKIQIVKRNAAGQIEANESFSDVELKNLIVRLNQDFFGSFFNGRSRRRTLDLIFETIERLREKDKPGSHRIPIRDK